MSTSESVELVFPYKDCVLEGGQTKEDQKRQEIFYNELLAPDDIDRLLYPKVFCGAKRYSLDQVDDIDSFSENDNLMERAVPSIYENGKCSSASQNSER